MSSVVFALQLPGSEFEVSSNKKICRTKISSILVIITKNPLIER